MAKTYRIGQIVPSSNTTMETEVPAMLQTHSTLRPNDHFTFHSGRMRVQRVQKEELAAMDAESDCCALELSDACVDVHGCACLVRMASSLMAAQRHSESIATELFSLTSNTVLIFHSASGPCGWTMATIDVPCVKAIIAVEPQGEPGLVHPQGMFTSRLCSADFVGTHDPYFCPIAFETGEATGMRGMNARASEYIRKRRLRRNASVAGAAQHSRQRPHTCFGKEQRRHRSTFHQLHRLALNEERLTVVLPPSVLALPLLADLTLMEIIL
ncbi:hypothetical protein [Massilia orientalis]|uniref:Uncharacterized protein n=1 Tax=Massilia orientalis TaxID=3050128 RepID=A0ACC7MLL8_9BURK|nr:hypothetical protein [Massilia sp. YIM B02787]